MLQTGDRVRIIAGAYAGQLSTVLDTTYLGDLGGVTLDCYSSKFDMRLPQWHLVSQINETVKLELSLSDELELILKEK